MLSSYTDGFFSVDPKHGFLPIAEPLAKLPETFSGLQSLIDEMPIVKEDGSPGLLAAEGAFEKAVLALPNYVGDVQTAKDPFVLAALFRAYGFVTSAYTLAPSHHSFLKTGKYGKAHEVLPANVAQPFVGQTLRWPLNSLEWMMSVDSSCYTWISINIHLI